MNRPSRIAMTTLLVFLGAVAVYRWKPASWIAPTAAIAPTGESTTASESGSQVTHQPTVVRAKPLVHGNTATSGMSPRYWENVGGMPPFFAPKQPVRSDASTASSGVDAQEYTPSAHGRSGEAPHPAQPPQGPWPSPARASEEYPTTVDGWPVSVEAAHPAPVTDRNRQPPPGLRHVVTQDNDSFWDLSVRLYGTGVYFKALYRFNRNRVTSPDRLPAGIEILAPPADELARLFPDDILPVRGDP